MKTKNKILDKFLAFLMLFSFANLLAYNIVQLQCVDSCAIHSKMNEETCHTKINEKSCCPHQEEKSDNANPMDLADCNCDHSYIQNYVNTNINLDFNVAATIAKIDFPVLEENIESNYPTDIQTQFNNTHQIYKSIETFLI